MKKLLYLASLLMFASCTSSTASEETGTKSLILYYSQTGATKTVAEELKNKIVADIEAIELENPYNGDFQQTIQRCQDEKSKGEYPKLMPVKASIEKYDTIYLGYPIWFGSYAPPISSLIKDYNFDNKVIIPFCTFGSGGLNTSIDELRKELPNSQIKEGYGVRNARVAKASKELDRFLIENGYKLGASAILAPFPKPVAVTDKEKEIFDIACGDYQFPLGTPKEFSSRPIENGTEYKFIVSSKGFDGAESTSTIYVVVDNEKDSKPEFTQVVR